MITKTTYLNFKQCSKAFWLATYRKRLATPPDAMAQRRFQQGNEVDQLAREQFPEGHFITGSQDEMVLQTTQAINNGTKTLFQATFEVDGLSIRADILTQTDDGWHLLEVKSSKSYEPKKHLADMAFQVYVLQQVGLNITKVSLMHLNKESTFPSLVDLFSQTEVTTEVLAELPQVAKDALHMKQLLAQDDMPDVLLSRQCTRPYQCAFYEYCWQHINDWTIHDIPRFGEKKTRLLETDNIFYLADVPSTFALTENQRGFVDRILEKKKEVDPIAIRQQLEALEYPLYFLDFETIDYAIPRFEGCRPHQKVPFQYSCHILTEDDELTHVDYLHVEGDDPRRPLADALFNHIGQTGHIIVYNASFERGILEHLAEISPDYAQAFTGMKTRLWDQWDIFKKHYKDYRFGNSTSLKYVLPAITDLSYDALDVQNGTQAQVVWEEMLLEDDPEEKASRIEQLKAYCHLDTLAMVEMHKVLARL